MNQSQMLMKNQDKGSLYEMILAAEQLKTVPRIGWIIKADVKKPESVADHSYALAIISMILGDIYGLDTLRMVRLALLHDISESLVGDIQPDDLPKNVKHELERKAFHALCKGLPNKLKRLYTEIFDDFLECKTEEAKLVSQLDKLEMALQATLYKKKGYHGLSEFHSTASKRVRDVRLAKMYRSILALSKG